MNEPNKWIPAPMCNCIIVKGRGGGPSPSSGPCNGCCPHQIITSRNSILNNMKERWLVSNLKIFMCQIVGLVTLF
jgi:hypothetical protein